MINSKGAIELSINMIVMIVISLAILAAGIVLLNNLISGAEDIQQQLDQNTQQRLNDLLVSQGQQVALPFHTATIERGENHIFGIGILNTGQVGNIFQLAVEFDKYLDPRGQEMALTDNPLAWARYEHRDLTIIEGENQKLAILISVPRNAVAGQYLFKAKVLLPGGETYGNVQRFYVKVK